MPIFTNVLIVSHVISTAIWVGAVFMGSVIDPPAAQKSMGRQGFPVSFFVEQGIRVFPYVYFGIVVVFISGIGLIILYPPQNGIEIFFLSLKLLALAIMTGNTLYGTLRTWPKIQFATPDEAEQLWAGYKIRAFITLGCGIAAMFFGIVMR